MSVITVETGGSQPAENAAHACPIISDNRRQRLLEITEEPSGCHGDSPRISVWWRLGGETATIKCYGPFQEQQ